MGAYPPTNESALKELFPDPPWVAWRRCSGGKWREVGGADSEADAWALLYEAMDRVRSGAWDNTVLPRGQRP